MGDVWGAAWRSLRSTQSTLRLLVAIAVASAVGMLVPQGQPAEAYNTHLGKALGPLVVSLGLDHVFTTWWYLLLLALLLVSAAACAKRIGRLGRAMAAGPSLALLQRRLQATTGAVHTQAAAGEPEQVRERLTRSLRGHGYRLTTAQDEAGGSWLVGRKHGWAGYGLFLSHVAIFSIALGALIGMWPGTALDKPVNLTEGSVYQDKEGDFDFSLRLNSFSLENYPDGSVKAYDSDVSILEGDKEVKRQVIMVNHPLTYKHVNFYQSSYGVGEFTVKVTPANSAAEELHFPVQMGGGDNGPEYNIPEESAVQFIGAKQAALVARGFSPTGPDDKGCPAAGTGASAAGGAPCAAAQVTLVSGFAKGGNHSFQDLGWLQRGQSMKAGNYTLELEPVRYFTGLTARRDYGVPLVWLGFALLTGGLIATFYFKPHTLVARVTSSGAGQQVTMAAFEKGGAGQERWQERPYPVIGRILGGLQARVARGPGSGAEGREEEEDDY